MTRRNDEYASAYASDIGGPTPYPTTSRVLEGLDRILWEVARLEDALRDAAPNAVTAEDWKTFRKAFRRIDREAETLTTWLRFTPIELPRN
jgi:hypothetical protein